MEALLLACEENRAVELTSLLRKPLDPNGANAAGDLSPFLVAVHIGHLDLVQLLLEAGADTNAAKANGATALIVAVWSCQLEVVQLLLEAGAWTNAADADGGNCLDCCSFVLPVGSGAVVAGGWS